MAAPVRSGGAGNTTTVNGGTGTSATVSHTEPSNTVNDDLLITISVNDEPGAVPPSWSGPVGFAEQVDVGDTTADVILQVATRIRDGNETTPFVATADTSNNYCGVCDRVTGVDTTDPIDVVGTATNNDSQLNHTAAKITTTVADCLVYAVVAWDGGHADTVSLSSQSTTDGWTIVQEVNNDSGNQGVSALAIATKTQATAGDTKDCVFVASNNISSVTVQFAVAPAASGTDINMALASFTLTGYALTITEGTKIEMAHASFALTGHPVSLQLGEQIAMALGSLSLTGHDLTVSPGALIAMDRGDLVLTGFDALVVDNKINMDRAQFNLIGHALSLGIAGTSILDTWPATLPQQGLLRNRRLSSEGVVLRSELARGPSQQRGRAISAGVVLRVQMFMTAAQYATFDAFWRTTLGYASKRFNFPHPETQNLVECEMLSPPRVTGFAGRIQVDMQLYIEP